tara:strand:+ start:194 stop:580 length:387 start_codon:yes stop_codon:yes gene_type:complete
MVCSIWRHTNNWEVIVVGGLHFEGKRVVGALLNGDGAVKDKILPRGALGAWLLRDANDAGVARGCDDDGVHELVLPYCLHLLVFAFCKKKCCGGWRALLLCSQVHANLAQFRGPSCSKALLMKRERGA